MWVIGLAVVCFPLVVRIVNDIDIWWHLHIGRSVLQNWQLPDLATFYFSELPPSPVSDMRYTWLGDVTFFLSYSALGDAGVQLLVLINALALAWVIVHKRVRHSPTVAWLLALWVVACCYQFQIARNAAYSMGMLAGLLWVMDDWSRCRKPRSLVWLVLILPLWSVLHGSYILGIGLTVMFTVGAVWDAWGSAAAPRETIQLTGACLCASLLASLGSPLSAAFIPWLTSDWHLLTVALAVLGFAIAICRFQPSRRLISEISPTTKGRFQWSALALFALLGLVLLFRTMGQDQRAVFGNEGRVTMEQLAWFARLKHALNQMLWTPDINLFGSMDFRSPFDFLGTLHVWSSLLAVLIALITLIRARKFPLASGLPWLATVVIGMGYTRTIGYAGVMSVYLIAQEVRPGKRPRNTGITRIFAAAASLAFFVLPLIAPSWLGLFPGHQSGFGHSMYFSKDVPSFALKQFGDQPIMTSLSSGGHLLFQWAGAKKVFMDGFFAPHSGSTLALYQQAMDTKDPNLLIGSGMRAAIVHVWDREWVEIFNHHGEWLPMAIDQGYVLYQHQSSPVLLDRIEVFLKEDELQRAPDYLRAHLSLVLMETDRLLEAKGRIQLRRALHHNHGSLLSQANAILTEKGIRVYASTPSSG